MKLLLSGGGTGGHIYPALAVGREWLRMSPENEVMYIGTRRGLENEIVPKAGFSFATIEIKGFKRSFSLDNLQTVRLFFRGVRVAKGLLREFRPDVVLGTGGYVAGPVLVAAHQLNIPVAIHEQNVIPGLTNRFLSRYASLIAVSFPGTERHFPARKTRLFGNPRASEVVRADPQKAWALLSKPSGGKLVLIVGGSRGAEAINDAFLSIIPRLSAIPDTHFVYVSGKVHYERISRLAEEQLACHPEVRRQLTIFPFLDEMPEMLAASTLVISRAGATILSELTALGRPAILIPSPYVTNNHQEKNAAWLTEAGAAVMIRERELTGERLFAEMKQLLEQPQRLSAMAQASRGLGRPDACPQLCRALAELARR
ncbi:MAG: undecaprenyldiphospho-muramoylpentapeptide beta-N-acetylglucosaminyltransferase [Bacillaceae bacterium G1]|nr:undecaprenyldiphospho-muramoylpentapeptide beta-N-acetylglucosaminyltransferase [Bacillota bacterium]OJF17477.1 MAG: undecaprenyldiphospho-muramoylpentapeptide beta-N-acetylglucosaminyltransferase [Bacillaceae bacterium G1]